MAHAKKDDITIPARDGFDLAATRYGDGDDVVLINSATAVPRRFYRRFAAGLAERGFTVVTYDYRGVGDSRPEDLRGFEARARDWGLLDMSGVIDWIRAEWSPQSLHLVGHSIGGQVAGMVDHPEHVDSMVTMSAQSGHWRLQGGKQKAAVALHAYLTLPILSALYGYMPWSKVGAEDLPRGVAEEWARWCRDPDYLLGDDSLPLERYGRFDVPILAYSIDDDDWGTPRAVDAMMKAYPEVERRHVSPRDLGLEKLGHLGVFRPGAELLWDETARWFSEPGLTERENCP
jgi:predicted alpha/beta hydrolase